jgi:hypothetical protein
MEEGGVVAGGRLTSCPLISTLPRGGVGEGVVVGAGGTQLEDTSTPFRGCTTLAGAALHCGGLHYTDRGCTIHSDLI